jgi:SAM-dependent methyltransferase
MESGMTVDTDKLNAFMGRMVGDIGAAMNAPLVRLGDRLGLYKQMAGAGALSADDLAGRSGVLERYVREWLNAQAASGYVEYDAATERYTLSDEAALALADESSPVFVGGAFDILTAAFADQDKLLEAFRHGRGLGWQEHDKCLFTGTERFFRPGYNANLVSQWIPALDGAHEALTRGAKVADVGCGFGASTIVMAQAYPNSSFVGFDAHGPSIDAARQRAADAGVGDRLRFEVDGAKTYPGTDYDLVAFFDCLHDMGDPVGAATHVRESLAPDGIWLLVEPFANDAVEANLNPVGRVYYAASTMICTPCSLSQEVGLGLGAQAGERRLRSVVTDGGFKRFRRATETPFNLVFEARP